MLLCLAVFQTMCDSIQFKILFHSDLKSPCRNNQTAVLHENNRGCQTLYTTARTEKNTEPTGLLNQKCLSFIAVTVNVKLDSFMTIIINIERTVKRHTLLVLDMDVHGVTRYVVCYIL